MGGDNLHCTTVKKVVRTKSPPIHLERESFVISVHRAFNKEAVSIKLRLPNIPMLLPSPP